MLRRQLPTFALPLRAFVFTNLQLQTIRCPAPVRYSKKAHTYPFTISMRFKPYQLQTPFIPFCQNKLRLHHYTQFLFWYGRAHLLGRVPKRGFHTLVGIGEIPIQSLFYVSPVSNQAVCFSRSRYHNKYWYPCSLVSPQVRSTLFPVQYTKTAILNCLCYFKPMLFLSRGSWS